MTDPKDPCKICRGPVGKDYAMDNGGPCCKTCGDILRQERINGDPMSINLDLSSKEAREVVNALEEKEMKLLNSDPPCFSQASVVAGIILRLKPCLLMHENVSIPTKVEGHTEEKFDGAFPAMPELPEDALAQLSGETGKDDLLIEECD